MRWQRDFFVYSPRSARISSRRASTPTSTAAVVSSLRNIPIPADWALIGEIGLTGEVRAVGMMDRRVSECARMGFTHLIVPKANLRALHAPEGVEIRGVSTLYEALAVLF